MEVCDLVITYETEGQSFEVDSSHIKNAVLSLDSLINKLDTQIRRSKTYKEYVSNGLILETVQDLKLIQSELLEALGDNILDYD